MLFAECNEPMVQGSSGILQPKEDYVVATSRPDGYTCFDLPSNKNTFTLTSCKCKCMTITKFMLWAMEICPNGHPLEVTVVYKTHYGQVAKFTWQVSLPFTFLKTDGHSCCSFLTFSSEIIQV